MKQKYLYIYLVALAAVFSCVQIDESSIEGQNKPEFVPQSFTATIEVPDQTKATLDGSLEDGIIPTVWQPSDKIKVFCNTMGWSNASFINVSTETSETALFEGMLPFSSSYIGLYPYNDNSMIEHSDWYGGYKLSFVIPEVQTYYPNTFDPSAAIMVAKSNDGVLEFKHLCGFLAVQMKGQEKVKTITFVPRDANGGSVNIAGEYCIGLENINDGLQISVDGSVNAGVGKKSITLTCSEPVALSKDVATPFYFVLPPADYSAFTLLIETEDGKIMVKEGKNPLTVTRSHVKPTSSLGYAETVYVDLSEIGHSNCYIVPQAGLYSFDATVIGNGEYGLVPEVNFHTRDVKIDPKSVELLWEDKAMISGLILDKGEVKFFSAGVEGNALVAVKDDSGKILWSWHIWVTDQPQEQVYVNNYGTFTMLDRNNGAIRNDRGTGEEWRESVGTYYQWGRKDPFVYGKYNTLYQPEYNTAQLIEYPTTYTYSHYGWTTDWNDNLWNQYQKTIYDPCPVGYRVPPMAVWNGFSKSGDNTEWYNMNVSGSFDCGWNFIYDGGNTSWYPATGRIGYEGVNEGWGDRGRLWTSHMDTDAEPAWLDYSVDGITLKNYDGEKENAYAVRCMKDEGHVDTSYPSVAVRNVVDVTSESATVIAEVFDEGISEVTERGIVWGLSEYVTIDNGTKVVADVAGGGEYSLTLTGLQNATVYYVRPYAVNSRGLSYGKVSSFRTTYAGEANNLSAYGTSNCYIVDPAYCKHYINGSVKGSGYESIGSVASVEVLWETNGYGMKTDPGTVIFDVTLKDGNIYFYTNGVEGNALVASKDAMGTILWSWHIWVTDTPQEQLYNYNYWLLDRNLGAVSADEGIGDEWKLSCGLMYQPERKDPFAGYAFTQEYAYFSVDNAVTHPTVYDYNWNSEDKSGFWSTIEKTVYDPCPVGYRIVVNDVWNGIQSVPGNGHGTYFYFDTNPSARSWYPVGPEYTPYGVSYWEEVRMLSAEGGYFWGNGNDHFHHRRQHGQVRCMKDEGYVDMSYPIVKMNVTTGISSTGATLNAEITNTGIAEITSRGFIWGTSADLTPENGTKVECGAGSGKFTKALEGLAHSTRYYVMAYATNERGTSYSNVTSFFTPYEGSAVNLSRNGTANCYIVPVAYSEYAFNASVKGNSDEPVGDIAEAVVLWETKNEWDQNAYDFLAVGDVIASVSLDGNMVHFFLPTEPVPGNAVIAVKDALGTILWSWHIWVVDYDPIATQQKYISGAVMMDRNLGALNVIPGDIGSLGLMYQWGRKDPFVGSGVTWGDGWMRAHTAPLDAIRYEYFNSSNDTIENAVKNPTVVYDDARWNEANDLWGYKKTMYDPCPAGWRVSDYAAWEGLVKSSDSRQEYIEYPEPYSTPAAYFPTAGYTSGEKYISYINQGSYLWLSEHRRFIDMYWDRNPSFEWRDVDYLHSVRCMKDDPDKNGDNEDYTEGDDYEWND